MTALRELTLCSCVLRVVMAVIIGGVLGLERGRKNRPAGFRTHMLVCLGSAMVMMTNQYIYQCFGTSDPARMGAQVISGIGFLGAGTIIITGRNQIKGLTTAAGLWTAACIGLAVGIGFYEGAFIGGVAAITIISILQRLDKSVKNHAKYIDLYLELDSQTSIGSLLEFCRDCAIEISDLQINSCTIPQDGNYCVLATARSKVKRTHQEVVQLLGSAPMIRLIEEIAY